MIIGQRPNTNQVRIERAASAQSRLIDLACLAVILLLVAFVFGRTLESYFIADDFGEVSYVHKIFNGQANLFWSNFVGNYMQIPSMAVWRPWLLATLVFDYAIWKANAFGYYLTNLLYYAGNTILIYALVRKLTTAWPKWRSQATGFFTAALFAVSPLHCESVTWVVGRVDIACCFYYLLGFLLLLNNGKRQRLTATVATISFWLALWTKEMAIGLPVMVTAAYLLIGQDSLSPINKLKHALLKAAPLWVSTIVYFPLRYLFLGTITGGYTGSIGASQIAGLLKRWLDGDTLHRIIYPLNYSLFQDQSIYGPVLSTVYFIAAALIFARLLNRELSLAWTAFLALWLATCAAPIYQLWGLGYDLEGSRFYYFLSLPLSFALPLLLLQPAKTLVEQKRKWPIFVSAAALLVLIVASGKIAYATNMTWVHAGKEAKAVFEQSKLLATQNQNEKLVILGLPKRHSAAHMILNGETYSLMLRPPFTETSIADQFITFEPILFGPAEFINASRFKRAIKHDSLKSFVWSSEDKQFKKLRFDNTDNTNTIQLLSELPQSSQWQPYHASLANFSEDKGAITVKGSQIGDGLTFPQLQVNPLAFDFLAFDYRSKGKHPLQFQATWNSRLKGSGQASFVAEGTDNQFRTAYIPLSRHWRWFTNPSINDLHLLLPATDEISIGNVRLLASPLVAPDLQIRSNSVANSTGVYNFTGDKLAFEVIRPKQSTEPTTIQVSKANFFFENYPAEEQATVINKTLPLTGSQKVFLLNKSYFQEPGFYQVRAVHNGITSDAITLQRLP